MNLPELQQMFRAFADVQTAEMLNLPRPRLETGKPIVVACPMSAEQAALQQQLVARYERLQSQKVDPREDNGLAITTDGRKLALDVRMLSGDAPDFPGSKMEAMLNRVADRWHRTAEKRSTQMIFCDMGVHPTPWGYSAYEEIIRKLVARGIPRQQIATIGEADSDAKKRSLFDKVRSGQVRVLIGSTTKMGTGTNVQKLLGALHELDAPWKPAEVEQREGRILRQGNENEEVAIYRYVTEGSFDAYMWVRREVACLIVWLSWTALTTPAVPSAVAYRHQSCRQRQSWKLSRQRTPTRWVQSGIARCSLSCQHQGGSGARLGGKTNRGKPTIDPVKDEQAKGAHKPGPKGTQSAAPLHIGSTRTQRLPGESWGLTHRVKQAEHGKPVSPPHPRQADRKGGRQRCG